MLEVIKLSKTYASDDRSVMALAEVSFTVESGEFLTIVGPSGCGKSTLLKCITGLLAPTSGQTMLQGKEVKAPPETLAMVFQDYSRSLLPWMTVIDNVLLPLKAKGVRTLRRKELSSDALSAVGLESFRNHYPWQLSGGMQQRVAIARALAYEPEILLMDEPFASVDAQTRAELEDLVLNLRATFGITVLVVTHDIDEAVYLGNRVVVLTTAPTVVHEIIDVDLPEERDQISTKSLPQFAELRTRVYHLIRGGRSSVTTDH